MTYDVLVIGAGPAGSTAALLLAKAGWSVAIVEKSQFPRRKVCGEFISATSLPLLRELGLSEVFERAGPDVRRVGLFAEDTSLASAMPRAADPLGWGRALRREQLDAVLLDRAMHAGAKVWQPCRVTGVWREKDRHACAIAAKGTRQLFARLVIAANGSWERAPLGLHLERAHKPSDLIAFKAHFRDCALPADLMPLLIFPGGYGGMVHSDGGRVSLSCCIRRDALMRCRKHWPKHSAAEAVSRHIEMSCLGVRQALAHAKLEGAWLAAGPIRPGIRRRYGDGTFFIGNIAGEAHPIIAEGISMAMQSAWLLGRRLIAGQDELDRAVPDIGRAYATDWRRCFAARLHAASAFAHLAMNRGTAALWPPIIKQFPKLLTFGAQLSGKAQIIPLAPAHRSTH